MIALDKKIVEFFWGHFIAIPESGCWIWTGHYNNLGYGRIKHKYKFYGAHRISYVVHNGEIPDNLCVLHTCDVRCCVNPKHLFLGAHADNMEDMVKKDRAHRWDGKRKGVNNPNCRLNEDIVRKIRLDNRKRKEIANEYGVSISTISEIKNYNKWSHVE